MKPETRIPKVAQASFSVLDFLVSFGLRHSVFWFVLVCFGLRHRDYRSHKSGSQIKILTRINCSAAGGQLRGYTQSFFGKLLTLPLPLLHAIKALRGSGGGIVEHSERAVAGHRRQSRPIAG